MANQDDINVFEPSLQDSAILPLQPDRPGPVISYLTRPMVPSPKQRRRDTLRGIASFVPFLSGELARVEGDKLGETLGLLDALVPAAAPAKAAAKAATKVLNPYEGIASVPSGYTIPGKVVADRIREGDFIGMTEKVADDIEKLPQVNYSTLDEMLPDFVSGADIRKVTNLELSGPEVASNMRKIKTEGGFPYLSGLADEVEKLPTVSPKVLDETLPDWVSGGDIRLVTNPLSSGIASLSDEMLDLKNVLDDVNLSNADKVKQITNHPAIIKAEKEMNDLPKTVNLPNFGTKDFNDNRLFFFGDKKIKGYDNAVDELYEGGKTLAYREMGLTPPSTFVKNTDEKIANILIGPPAAGKSAIANPLAIKYNATIIDPDEVKKVLPEFGTGVGGNAVHEESKIISNTVKDLAIRNGDNLLIPTIGAKPDKIRNSIQDLQNQGYKVNLVLTDLDPDLALVRMADRFLRKGRLIGQDQANIYKGQSNKTYDILKQEDVADGYGKIDTTTRLGEPKEIFEDTARIFEDAGI
jgi:predicted ABC-type ATPase